MRDWQKFKDLLDIQYNWPSKYLYKFVIPYEQLSKIEEIFQGEEMTYRSSKKGNYYSVTIWSLRTSSDHVIEAYQKAQSIQGIVML